MARIIKKKELVNTRLATSYGGWMYCDVCNENIGYLCYSTYDKIELKYQCNCGSKGSVSIDFEDSKLGIVSSDELVNIKNRLCCPKDKEPLLTLLDKKITSYDLKISCKSCGNYYTKKKI